jgi:hypothetical protein
MSRLAHKVNLCHPQMTGRLQWEYGYAAVRPGDEKEGKGQVLSLGWFIFENSR